MASSSLCTSGESARYQASRKRGHCWSVLPAYTIDDYLPCTGIREGWFNGEAFFRWLADELLPLPSKWGHIFLKCRLTQAFKTLKLSSMRLKSGEYEGRYRTSHSCEIMSSSIRALQCMLALSMTITLFGAGKGLHYAVERSRCDSISSIALKIISLKLILEPWKEILKLVL